MSLTHHSRNILSMLGGDFANRILGFLATTYLARTLGSSGFGVIGIGMAILTYVCIVGDLGINYLGTREVAAGSDRDAEVAGRVSLSRFGLTFLAVILAWFSLEMFEINQEIADVSSIYILYALPGALVLDWFFRAKQWLAEMFMCRLSHGLSFLIFIWFTVDGREDTIFAAIGWAMGGVINMAVLFIVFLRKGSRLALTFAGARRMIQDAVPLGFATLISQSVLQFPIIFLGWMATTSEAGIFNAAFKVVLLMLVMDRLFNNIFFPLISRMASQATDKLAEVVSRMARIVSAVSVSVGMLVIAVANMLIALIFGNAYAASVPIFQIMMGFVVLTLSASVLTYTLIAMGEQAVYTRSLLIGALVFAVALLIIPDTHVSEGLAAALILFELTAVAVMAFRLNSLLKLSLLRPLIFPLAVASAATTLMYVYEFALLWRLALIVIVAIPLCVKSAAVTKADYQFLRERLI